MVNLSHLQKANLELIQYTSKYAAKGKVVVEVEEHFTSRCKPRCYWDLPKHVQIKVSQKWWGRRTRETNRRQAIFKGFWKEVCCIRTPGKKGIESTSRCWKPWLRFPSDRAGRYWSSWPLHEQVCKYGLEGGVCLFWRRKETGADQRLCNISQNSSKPVLEKEALKICLAASTPWKQQCYKCSLMSNVRSSMLPWNFVLQDVKELSWKVILTW